MSELSPQEALPAGRVLALVRPRLQIMTGVAAAIAGMVAGRALAWRAVLVSTATMLIDARIAERELELSGPGA